MTTPAIPLEPCPWCGRKDTPAYIPEEYGRVSCSGCGAEGPMINPDMSPPNEQQAIAAWNGGVLRERLLTSIGHNAGLLSRVEAAEARVKELEDMLRWDNDARIAQESREIALDESALERGIREGWEARGKTVTEKWHGIYEGCSDTMVKYYSVDHYLKERKK